MDDLVYHYDPLPPTPLAGCEPGVTKGYIVLWNGEPGDGFVADGAALIDPDGQVSLEITGDFAPTTITD